MEPDEAPQQQGLSTPADSSSPRWSPWAAAILGAALTAALVIGGQQYFSASGDSVQKALPSAQDAHVPAEAAPQIASEATEKAGDHASSKTHEYGRQEQGPQQEMTRLLARAEQQIASSKLTTPTGNNAYETYQAILQLDAQHSAALASIEQIKSLYTAWAEQALQRGDFQRAETIYTKALSISPDDPSLLAAHQQLKQTAQAESIRLAELKRGEERQRKEAASKRRDELRTQPSQLGLSYTQQDFLNSARSGNQQAVAIFLNAGMSPDIKASHITPLMAAAGNGHTQVTRLLLQQKADVNKQADKGKTALMYAAAGSHLPVVRDLLAHKAGIALVNQGGGTVLLYAAWQGHSEIVTTLLKSGARIDRTDRQGFTPLIAAAGNGHPGTVRLLPAEDANIHAQTSTGETALRQAVAGQHQDVVALLRQAGAKL